MDNNSKVFIGCMATIGIIILASIVYSIGIYKTLIAFSIPCGIVLFTYCLIKFWTWFFNRKLN